MKISKSQENHIQTIFYRNHVFIILYSLVAVVMFISAV